MWLLWDRNFSAGKQNSSLGLFGQFVSSWCYLDFLLTMELSSVTKLAYKKRLNSVGLLSLKKRICDWRKSWRMSRIIIRSAFKHSVGSINHYSLQCKRWGLSQKSSGCRVKRSNSSTFSYSTRLNCGTHCHWIVKRPNAQADSGANYKNL